MKTYMILGGNGVFGVQLARYLLVNDPQARIVSVGRNPEKHRAYTLCRGVDDSRYEYHQIHMAFEPERLSKLIDAQKPEYIINFAALADGYSWSNSWRYFETNAVALAKVVEPLVNKSPWLKKWVQIGSSEVYGNVAAPATEEMAIKPSSPYSASKAAGDLYLLALAQAQNFQADLIRPSNAYGPGQQLHRIIPRTILSILNGKKLPLQGGGLARKSFIHTDDLSRSIIIMAEKAPKGSVYNAGPKDSISMKDLVQRICDRMRVSFDKVVDMAPDRIGQDAQYLIDSTKIERDFDWKPTVDLNTGLDDVIAWVKEYVDFLKTEPMNFTFRG